MMTLFRALDLTFLDESYTENSNYSARQLKKHSGHNLELRCQLQGICEVARVRFVV